MNRRLNELSWVLQVLLIIILLWDIAIKLTGTEQIMTLYRRLEMQGTPRFLSVVLEFIAIVGLCVPRFVREGAVMTIVLMAAGLFFYITELSDLKFSYDNGMRFYATIAGLVMAIAVWYIRNRLAMVLYKRGKL